MTWLLWAVAPLLAAAVEFDEGVGLRALPTFMVGFMPLLVFLGLVPQPGVGLEDPADRLRLRRHVRRRHRRLAGDPQRRRWPSLPPSPADFLAGIPTLMKSWTHPETETVYSYLGAVISMGILLLTIDHWTFEVAAFPHLHRVRGLGRGGPGRPRARARGCAAPGHATAVGRAGARLSDVGRRRRPAW